MPSAELEQRTLPLARTKMGMAIIFAMVLAVYVVALSINPSRANDLFWQLRAGQQITQTHLLPHADTYSWTRAGTPWVVHEWLSFVIFWRAYESLHGFAGIWLLEALILVAAFLILFAVVYKETGRSSLVAFLLTAGAATSAAIFFQPRPQIFTYLFVTVTMGLVLRARREPRTLRHLWVLVPLYAVWANLHAGVLIGTGILVIFGLADTFTAARRDKTDPGRALSLSAAKHIGLISMLCILATLVTPYGLHLYQNFGATIGNTTAMEMVSEWASPNFHDSFGKFFEVLLGVVLFGLIRTRERRDLAELLIIVVVTHAALGANRNVPLFALISVPLAARHIQSALAALTAWWLTQEKCEKLYGARPPAGLALLMMGCILIASTLHVTRLWRQSPDTAASPFEHAARISVSLSAYPEDACRFLIDHGLPKECKLFNIYGDGGFLIWRMPQHPVFIDGRADIYFGPLLDTYAKMKKLPPNYLELLNTYQPDAVISSTTEAQSKIFLGSPDWALIYADSATLDGPPDETFANRNTLVFLRRTAGNTTLIEQYRNDCPNIKSILNKSTYCQWGALR